MVFPQACSHVVFSPFTFCLWSCNFCPALLCSRFFRKAFFGCICNALLPKIKFSIFAMHYCQKQWLYGSPNILPFSLHQTNYSNLTNVTLPCQIYLFFAAFVFTLPNLFSLCQICFQFDENDFILPNVNLLCRICFHFAEFNSVLPKILLTLIARHNI